MAPLVLMGIMAAAGLAKALAVDAPKEARQRKVRGAETRYSPWTGLAPSTQIQEADPMGSAMQYGMTGLQLGQANETHDLKQKLLSEETGLAGSQIALNKAQTAAALDSGSGPTPSFYGKRPGNPWNLGVDLNLGASPYYTQG